MGLFLMIEVHIILGKNWKRQFPRIMHYPPPPDLTAGFHLRCCLLIDRQTDSEGREIFVGYITHLLY